MIEVIEDQVLLFEFLEKSEGAEHYFKEDFYSLCKSEGDLILVIFVKEKEPKGLYGFKLSDYENNYFVFHELISAALKRYEFVLQEDLMHEIVLDIIKEADKIKARGWFLEGH